MKHVLHHGNCLEVLKALPHASVDAVITDPPYGLSFMGQEWDHGVPGVEFWRAALRVLQPGGYMLVFGGTRTYHRLACAIEDGGFAIRDCLMWLYGTGFPKGKGCLKPAWEPILMARKLGPKVMPLGIDECRVPGLVPKTMQGVSSRIYDGGNGLCPSGLQESEPHPAGRWPANVIHDGSKEVLEAFAVYGETSTHKGTIRKDQTCQIEGWGSISRKPKGTVLSNGDTGTAARFFYCAKASRKERGAGNAHPTVKPLALMRWLIKLVCSSSGVVLDPFMGSGSTGVACLQTGRRFVGIEICEDYCQIARQRIEAASAEPPLFKQGAPP